MIEQKTYTAEEVRHLRAKLGFSLREMAVALNVTSPAMIAAWEEGVKGGKPYLPTGTAVAALESLLAIYRAVDLLGPEHAVAQVLLDRLPGETARKIVRSIEEYEG